MKKAPVKDRDEYLKPLKCLMQIQGISVPLMADLIGINAPTLRSKLRGENPIKLDEARRMAQALNMAPEARQIFFRGL